MALIDAPSSRSAGGATYYRAEDVLSWWRYWRPGLIETGEAVAEHSKGGDSGETNRAD